MKQAFQGLIPQANKLIGKTIGKELEVLDIDYIINSNIKNIQDIIKKDYDELRKESESLYYWESHITLNKKLEDVTTLGELRPISVENVFEINEVIIYRTTDVITGEFTERRMPGTWWESHVMLPSDAVISIFDALKAYWNSDVPRTTGDKVTLRRPYSPLFEVPYYIIGQQNSPLFVFVNSVTGEIRY